MTTRDRTVLAVVLMVAALGAFWFLALSPKRKDASALGSRVDSAQQRLDTARQDAVASQQARTRYAVSYGNVARLGKAVPADDDVPSLVYQLDSTAAATGVDFRSIKISQSTGAPAPVANAAQASAATQDQADKKGQAAATNATGATAATPAGATAPAASQPGATALSPASATPTQSATATLPPGAVVGPAGFATMPFNFEFTGSFFKLADFFGQVDRYIRASAKKVDVTGRLLMIDGISLKASSKGFPSMSAAVVATTYLLPQAEGATGGASPAGPAAGAAQTVNAGTTTSGAPATATATGPKP